MEMIHCFMEVLQKSKHWNNTMEDAPLPAQVLCGTFYALLVRSFNDAIDDVYDDFRFVFRVIASFGHCEWFQDIDGDSIIAAGRGNAEMSAKITIVSFSKT
ncbi:hypothetical protein BZA77DRAFT_295170 [Pyronema omphalodes]|nr:hypothetical protein BZA77DRAFT_295170 [Pyronema omphalodes]